MGIFGLWKYIAVGFVLLLSACSLVREPHTVFFENRPCIIPVENFTYETCQPFAVKVDNNLYVIPKGFHTDLASIPRIFWNILPPQQADFIGPAILHDWMYTTHICSRKYADDVLYATLRNQGAAWDTANVIWLCVRIWGGEHYKEASG